MENESSSHSVEIFVTDPTKPTSGAACDEYFAKMKFSLQCFIDHSISNCSSQAGMSSVGAVLAVALGPGLVPSRGSLPGHTWLRCALYPGQHRATGARCAWLGPRPQTPPATQAHQNAPFSRPPGRRDWVRALKPCLHDTDLCACVHDVLPWGRQRGTISEVIVTQHYRDPVYWAKYISRELIGDCRSSISLGLSR